jgi:predicted Zn-dependent protease
MSRRRFLMGAAAGTGTLLVAGCSTNPLTGREQLMLVSDEQLAQMSFSTWQQVQRKYPRGGTAAQRQAVTRVGRDMVDASGLGGTRDWQFEVFEGPSNAFVLPGGQVAVFTGILEDFENDAQMAAVVGHEVGHVAGRHSAERVSQNLLASAAVGGASAILAGMGTDSRVTQIAIGALGAGATFGILLPYSRKHELEADRLGVEYMARQGYDPREAREFWVDRIEEREDEGPPEFMSTHPADETRIAQIERLLPRVMPVYRSNADLRPQGAEGLEGAQPPGSGIVTCDLGDGRTVRVTARTCFDVGGLPL